MYNRSVKSAALVAILGVELFLNGCLHVAEPAAAQAAKKKPIRVEDIVHAVHGMLEAPSVQTALTSLGVELKEVTLDLHTATTESGDVSVTFIGSLEGALEVASVQELKLKLAPPPKKEFSATGIGIPSESDLVKQLKLAEAAAAASRDEKHPLVAKSVEVEFDFGVTTSGKGGADFQIWGVGAKVIAGIKHEETQKLILGFGAPS